MFKFLRSALIVMFFGILFIGNTLQVSAEQSIKVTVNGQLLQFDSEPTIKNGTTLVPMRKIFESLNLNVKWVKETQQIIATDKNNVIVLTINSKVAKRNNTTIELEVVPQIINGSTYVPVRFIAESLDSNVKWDNKSRTVIITTSDSKNESGAAFTDYVPYSTSDLSTLAKNVLEGKVVYFDGQYWATPEYANLLSNEEVVYEHDISNDGEIVDRYALIDVEIDDNWISESDLMKMNIAFSYGTTVDGKFNIDLWSFKEVSNVSGMVQNVLYIVPDMDDEFTDKDGQTKTFSGIEMKNESGNIYFYKSDLIEKEIIKQ